ncbi:MAG: LysM peptidoglycan-binding domain-containing protein [Lentisphaeraceae bacterium]|nr:LysM peptidoglycan-binding domain-containing protein [Lentisphaeraceae bacterium]
MAFRKFSVFILVVAFHIGILGIVYVSTLEETKVEDVKVDSSDEAVETKVETPKLTPTKEPVKKPTSKKVGAIHVVQKGEFLGKIAAKYKVSAKDIMDLNNIDNPNKINLGQKIKIPSK